MILKYIKIGIAALICILSISTYYLYQNNQELQDKLNTTISNEKAFMSENTFLKNENLAFKFTIEQLNYYNDSILEKMNSVRKELRVKNDELKQMQYLLSKASRKDTIIFRDTLFRVSTLDIDTIIGDSWYNIKLGLKYPSTISITPTFISEKYIIVNTKKETINPPKKCWLARLLQKKHKIVEVNIVEKSPYIENKYQRFIEIIK